MNKFCHLIRLHKPAGIFLLFWPCVWPIASHISFYDFLRFFLGAFAMRSAGCIVNDLIDQDLDAHVERTKNRPLASKELSSLTAFLILIFCLLGAFLIWLSLSPTSKLISFIAMLGAGLYPFLKRFTYFPQLGLALIFNSGVWVAWFEHHHAIEKTPVLLYLGGLFWTLSYDTSYALLDLKDDLKLGIKSTAVKFKEKTHIFILSCQFFMGLCLFPLISWGSLVLLLGIKNMTLIKHSLLGGVIFILLRLVASPTGFEPVLPP